MWKRLNQRDRQPSIGSPTLIETDLDPVVLQNSTNINNGEFSLSSRPAFGTRNTGDVLKGLPDLPLFVPPAVSPRRPTACLKKAYSDPLDSNSLQTLPSSQNQPALPIATPPSVHPQVSSEVDDQVASRIQHLPISSSVYPEDVSPPNTPRMQGANNKPGRTTPDISPVSATPSPTASRSPPLGSGGSRKYNSNLPVPKNNLKKFWKLPNASKGSPDPELSAVRWDEYSGEPTESERGKPPSTTPGSVKLHESPVVGNLNNNYGTSTHISSGTVPARKRVGSREITDSPVIVRPEWKGAGGRHSIVKPVFDKPLPPGTSPNFPVGSHKQRLEEQERERIDQMRRDREQAEQERLEMVRADLEQQEKEQEEAEAARLAKERSQQEERERDRERQQRLHRERIEHAKRGRERLQQEQEIERAARQRVPPPAVPEPLRLPTSKSPAPTPPKHLEPTPPHILDAIETQYSTAAPRAESRGSSETTTPSVRDPKTRVGSLATDDMRSPLARNPSHEELKDRRNQALPSLPSHSSGQPSPSTPSIQEQPSPKIVSADFPPRDTSLNDPNQIGARFHSDLQHMSLQDQPQSRFSTTTVATTAYDNGSPPQTPDMASGPPSNTTTPSSILNRKRPVATSGMNVKRKPTPSEIPSGTPNSVSRTDSKSLPKPPPDAPIENPVQILQAKQDVLRRRRRNLQTVIHELTNVVQPSSVAYDRASRTEIKKTVLGLEKELSEVVKDEHETGLRLHRAWKRHDDFAAYEPTSIWVRRVTS